VTAKGRKSWVLSENEKALVSRAVEAATARAETLAAERFTAADIVIGYALRLAETIGLAKDFGPNVAAYWQRLQARDGFKRAVAAEEKAGEQQKVARHS